MKLVSGSFHLICFIILPTEVRSIFRSMISYVSLYETRFVI